MDLLLSSRAKTVPTNYDVVPVELTLEDQPGYSCTPDQWAKAKRMESEYYDWESYEACVLPKVEHPAYAAMTLDHKLHLEWNKVLHKLEPLPRLP